MLFIHRKETDPYFNAAAEEYFLKNFSEDVFSLWVNDPCVVIGKHQNALAEINYEFIKKNNIPVVRRISGGGTVYQDPGNLNFSFIVSGEKEKLVNFRKHTRPVIDFLRTIEIEAEFEGKSNIFLYGKKFSGNAAHVYRDRIVHHGTILFEADLESLGKALAGGNARYEDRSVQSVRKPVINLLHYVPVGMSMNDFAGSFFWFMMNNYPGGNIYELGERDREEIKKLSEEKYRTWEWNFGYSPDYKLKSEIEENGNKIELELQVSKGMIRSAVIGNGLARDFSPLEEILAGMPHREEILADCLRNVNFENYFAGLSREEFINHLF